MLRKRVIPCLLLKEGRMVKGKQFQNFRDTGNPVTAARIYNAQSVDELLFIDIDASKEERSALIHVIEEVSKELFIPFCVGGGIKNIETIRTLLRAGADKISICTAAVENPEFIREAVQIFGSQCIVICIDYKKEENEYVVYTHSGNKKTNKNLISYVKELNDLNVGELLLNSIDRDGMMTGYDLDLLKVVTSLSQIPVIALGGVGKLSDFSSAFTDADVSAVSAASIFHFTDQSPIKVNFFLKTAGVHVR
jgi:imidazole glycerol-phosphate synthase subunit HisF